MQGFILGAERRRIERLPRRAGRAGGQRKRQRRNGAARQAQPLPAALRRLAVDARRSSRRCRAKTARSGKATRSPTRAFLTARVSPNGRYLAFMCSAPITGYDNVDASPEAKGARDEEVYPLRLRRPRACAASRATRPARGPPACSTRTNPAKASGCSSTAARSGRNRARTLARRQHPGLDGAEPHERAVPVAVPLRRRAAVLQQPRRSRSRGEQPQGERLRVRALGGRQLRKRDRRLCRADLLGQPPTANRRSSKPRPTASSVFFVTEANLLPQDTDTAFDIYDARTCTSLSPCLTIPAAGRRRLRRSRNLPPGQPPLPAPGRAQLAARASRVPATRRVARRHRRRCRAPARPEAGRQAADPQRRSSPKRSSCAAASTRTPRTSASTANASHASSTRRRRRARAAHAARPERARSTARRVGGSTDEPDSSWRLSSGSGRRRACASAPRALAAALALAGAAPAPARAAAPWWHISSETAPTNLPPGGEGQVIVVVSNLGDAPIDGSTVAGRHQRHSAAWTRRDRDHRSDQERHAGRMLARAR